VPRELEVSVESFGQLLRQHASDISEGGIFLATPAPPPVGAPVSLVIRLPDGSPPIRGEGQVAWRRAKDEDGDRPAGAGIRFLRLDERGRELIRLLVAARGEIPPPAAPGTPAPHEPFPEIREPAPPAEPAADVFPGAADGGPAAPPPSEPGWTPLGPARPRHRLPLPALVAAGLAVAGLGAAWWAGWLGPPRHPQPVPGVTPAPPPAVAPTPSPAPSPATTPLPTAVPAAEGPELSWRRTADGTEVRIETGVPVAPGRVRLLRLDDPPRVLVRIRGVRRQVAVPVLPAGTPELVRIRAWLHDELRPPELFVVLDLAGPHVRASLTTGGGAVVVRLGRPPAARGGRASRAKRRETGKLRFPLSNAVPSDGPKGRSEAP